MKPHPLPFCVTSIFGWILTRGPIENTAKVKRFVYIFWQLCNSIYIFTKSYMNPVIHPNHSFRRVLCILYLHTVDVWGAKYWSTVTNRLSFCNYILYWWPVGDANSIGCHGGNRRSSPPEVFLDRDILKLCNKFRGEHQRWSVISIKFQSNFIEIELWHGCYPVNLLHIFRTPFPKNTSGGLLL